MQQMSLFEKEERAAIMEFEGKLDRTLANRLAGIEYQYRGPIPYLLDLIKTNEPIINLAGDNPHICCIRTYASWEPAICSARAWVNRMEAHRHLLESGYGLRGKLHCQNLTSEVWHRPQTKTG